MATPPNNFFAENVFTIPDPESEPTGSPLTITINPFAEGITTYTLSCATLGSYVTYFNIVGPTIGTDFYFYLPSTNSLLGQTVTVKNMCADNVVIEPSTAAAIDATTISGLTLRPPATPNTLGAATLYADPTDYDSWYVINTFRQP